MIRFKIKDCGCSFNRSLFLILFFCIGLSLKAENVGKGAFLGGKLVETLHELNIPLCSSIFIWLQAPESHDFNNFVLQERLLKNGFTVVETEQFADYSVIIKVEGRFINRRIASFPRRDEMVKETSFLVQFMRIEGTQVLDIKRFDFHEKRREEAQVRNKWYSPFLTTFVIGSLVYLLYFGL